MHVYEIRPRPDKRGVDLISDALPFGRLWYGEPNAVSSGPGRKRPSTFHRVKLRKFERALSIHRHLRLSYERARSRDCSDIYLTDGFCLRGQPFSRCKGRQAGLRKFPRQGVASPCKSSSRRRGKSFKKYLKELYAIKIEDVLDLDAFKKKGFLLGNNDLGIFKCKSKTINPRQRRGLPG